MNEVDLGRFNLIVAQSSGGKDSHDFYAELIDHPKVVRVAALSDGYSQHDADVRLARNHDLIASFSRALTEGLRHQQTDDEFDKTLDTSIAGSYQASVT